MFIAGIIIIAVVIAHVIGWVITAVEDTAEMMGKIVDGPGDTGPSQLEEDDDAPLS